MEKLLDFIPILFRVLASCCPADSISHWGGKMGRSPISPVH
jgi:hypothetical protein